MVETIKDEQSLPDQKEKPPHNRVVANQKNARGGKSPGVVAKPEVARGGKSSGIVVANDEDDEDDRVVATKPRKDARIEIAARKRDKGRVYIIRWRWQLKDKTGEPLRTASGGYKRGSQYVATIESEREAKQLRKYAR